MSADRPDPETFVDDRHADDPDPFDIVPEGFLSRYGTTSVLEALRLAEADDTRTDDDQFPRCPECLSTRIRRKPGAREIPHKRDEDYKCAGCGEHFNTPAPSREEARPGEQVTFREVSRRS